VGAVPVPAESVPDKAKAGFPIREKSSKNIFICIGLDLPNIGLTTYNKRLDPDKHTTNALQNTPIMDKHIR
jgi:hypothetical protein